MTKSNCCMLFIGLFYLQVGNTQDIPQRVTELEKKVASLEATVQKMIAVVEEQTIPAGTIVAFGGPESQIPSGWLHCDGDPYEISKYPKLAEALAKSWGINSSETKFNVPDLRGRFLRGWDETADIDPDKLSRKSKNGSKSGNNVGSYQEDATTLPNTEFSASTNSAGEPGMSGVGGKMPGSYQINLDPSRPVPNIDTYRNVDGRHSHTLKITSGGDAETRPTNACVIYIIKAE